MMAVQGALVKYKRRSMNDIWLNIRFGNYHLQGEYGFNLYWTYNPFHDDNPVWFEVYTLFGYNKKEE